MNPIIVLIEVMVLVGISAICSGLNIALMALHISDLERKAKLGDNRARRVLPLRRNIHLSLASILLSNVAVISTTSLVLEPNFNGLIAGVVSTLLIVIFGEVLPQALFAKNALSFTSRFVWLLRLMIIVTFPVSWPLQQLLDKLLGPEAATLQSRRELGLLIAEHIGQQGSELDDDEIEIMRGALTLSEKRVRDIMTPMRTVYWLQPSTIIDNAKMDEIKSRSWSRIPVFNAQRTTSYGLLLMKDLVDMRFNHKGVRVDDLPLYPTQVVGSMTALDTLFRKFISAGTHLMPVERDDRIVGIVTIEDLLEEIVGREIEDESDRSRRLSLRDKQPRG